MKGYYLFAPMEPENLGPHSGVERKVRAQHKALSQSVDCDLVILPAVEYTGSKVEKIIRRLPFTAAWRKWEYKGEFNDADFLYIRQVYHDDSFVRYLRAIKTQNPSVKIVYEVPTYPYDQQMAWSASSAPFLLKERINRKKVARLVDRIVTFYGQKSIWGVPCIPLMNGFDFSSAAMAERTPTDEIHMVSVAATAFWHGYQYMIEGLRDYYANGGKEKIIFHMVGNVLPEHAKMVKDYRLDDCVVFHGKLSGEELNKVYNQCSLGINTLGPIKDGNPMSSSLKSREYAAFGLPIVSALPIDYLPADYEYLYLVPATDEPINIQGVVNYYHRVFDGKDRNAMSKIIRDNAKQLCDMQITMKPVIEWLLQTKESNE